PPRVPLISCQRIKHGLSSKLLMLLISLHPLKVLIYQSGLGPLVIVNLSLSPLKYQTFQLLQMMVVLSVVITM
ncbi:hypothetical protein BJP24_22100, partial [Aeromonas allosaccharophila]